MNMATQNIGEPTKTGIQQMLELPWYDEVSQLGIPIHECGRYSSPMCPQHGWLFIRKFGKYRWGCAHGLRVIPGMPEKFLKDVARTQPQLIEQWMREKRCWSNCHFKIEYKPPARKASKPDGSPKGLNTPKSIE